jgi:dynein intermediate chain
MSPEEASHIINTGEFQSFFDNATRLVERVRCHQATHPPSTCAAFFPTLHALLSCPSSSASQVLNVKYDPLVDYGASEEVENDVAPGESVRLNCTFFDKRWSTGRTVTCMDWSAKHPELIAVGYNDNPDAIHEPDGVVMVWNTHMTSRPEYVFECQVRWWDNNCFLHFP